MKTLFDLQDLPLYFLGDHHGEYSQVLDILERDDVRDIHIIHVGDGGEGFEPRDKELRNFEKWNKRFAQRNIYYKSIRGNHSDPYYFRGFGRIQMSHFELIEDYTSWSYRGKIFLGIGGAVSLDRCERIEGKSYWKDEEVILDKEQCIPCDVLVTHSTSLECYPQSFENNNVVDYWSRKDPDLKEALKKERKILSEIRSLCKPSLHVYGHFHNSVIEYSGKCKNCLLGIKELKEFII